LIDKILIIKDKEFLKALDKLISSDRSDSTIMKLSEEHKMILEMSEDDIKNGRLISQEVMAKRNVGWTRN